MRWPVRSATGASKLSGPLVTCTGSEVRVPSSRHRSMLSLWVDWKTKYLPSAVQVPQHSEAGLLQLGRIGWGVWSDAVSSHSDRVWLMGSSTVKRSRVPEGDQRSQKARPMGSVANGVDVPSLRLVTASSFPAAERMPLPSGIQVASWARMLETRRADPPLVGTTQRGCSDSGERWLRSKRLDPSGEISPRDGEAISPGNGTGCVSPRLMDICERAGLP